MWPPTDSRCVQGIFMESIAHQLLAYGGEFSGKDCVLLSGGLKTLTGGAGKSLRLPSVDNWDWAVNEADVIELIKKHRVSKTDGYIRPVAGNFPAIDSVFVLKNGDVLLTNSTIQRDHPIIGDKAVQTFKNLYGAGAYMCLSHGLCNCLPTLVSLQRLKTWVPARIKGFSCSGLCPRKGTPRPSARNRSAPT